MRRPDSSQRNDPSLAFGADSFGQSEAGPGRAANEDQFLIAQLSKSMLVRQSGLSIEDGSRFHGELQGQLFLVADGAGQAVTGQHASALTVRAAARYVLDIMPWFDRIHTAGRQNLHEELRGLVMSCHGAIRESGSPARHVLASTLTLAYVLWPDVYVVHAGDSRCYLQRDDRLEQITRDHTVLQRLVEGGAAATDIVDADRLSDVLWNTIGGADDRIYPEVYRAELRDGDTLLLTTDGLTASLGDNEILATLRTEKSAEACARSLVAAALEAGAEDDRTAVVARFDPATRLVEVSEEEALTADAAKTFQESSALAADRQAVDRPPEEDPATAPA